LSLADEIKNKKVNADGASSSYFNFNFNLNFNTSTSSSVAAYRSRRRTRRAQQFVNFGGEARRRLWREATLPLIGILRPGEGGSLPAEWEVEVTRARAPQGT
jgi:hypothetical protein